jgi:predicted acylesterase/phospholipase RssA
MYVVISGRLRVAVSLPDGNERLVGEASPGELVGELGLLTGEPRSATVYAVREANVAKLTEPVFARLLERHPQVMMNIMRLIVKRQQRTLRAFPVECPRALTLALIPTGDAVLLGDFAHHLAQSLEDFGPVLHLDSARLDQIFGREGAAQTTLDDPTSLVLAGWMGEQETRVRTILYVADPTWSPWTQRCVRQADRLLLIGQAEAAPTPGRVERAIQSLGVVARSELVLLHPARVDHPSDTNRWLAPRQVHAHHHVRVNNRLHYKRLARRLSGQAIGLVLSGGGARGLAHVGVFRALEELGVPIDRVGGTSMGALMGGLYATGRSFVDIVDVIRKYFSRRTTLFDFTLPLVSLMATEKITDAISEVAAGLRLEDLWCPFFCVSSNLSRAELVVHQTGPAWEAVRASVAIPGVFAPILYEGDLLVDGGIMNNFPVDIMHGLCEGGPVIGVNVSPPREKAEEYRFGASISGWEVLKGRINPLAQGMQVPSLVGNLARTMEINSLYRMKTEQNKADLLVQPDVRQFAILDFTAYEPIIEQGYQAARGPLVQWLAQQKQGLTASGRWARVGPVRQLTWALAELESVLDGMSEP